MSKFLKSFKFTMILLLLGCNSNDDSNNNTSSFMRADIDSVSWESTSIELSNLNVFNASDFQQLLIKGANDDFKITVVINEQISSNCITEGMYTGTFVNIDYSYKTDSGVFLTEYYNDPINNSLESDAIVNITECSDGSVSGTFSGTLYKGTSSTDTVSITNGEFQNITLNLIEN
jgi:hypothetical protein